MVTNKTSRNLINQTQKNKLAAKGKKLDPTVIELQAIKIFGKADAPC